MSRAVWLALGLVACGPGDDGPEPLVVFASASLTDAFRDLERSFERAHPDIDVQLSFAGSQVLAMQLAEGAPAAVFATAHPEHLDTLVARGRLAHARLFARNDLLVIVPQANPAGLATFRDLPRAERLVVGTPASPIGAHTRELFARAADQVGDGFHELSVVSEESNVRLVRAKVQLGEADAAVVYRTELGPGMTGIEVPASLSEPVPYAIGAVEGHAWAQAFVDWVASDTGQNTLQRHGFAPADARSAAR